MFPPGIEAYLRLFGVFGSLVLLLLVLSGCASLDPEKTPKVVVYPLMDMRFDRKVNLKPLEPDEEDRVYDMFARRHGFIINYGAKEGLPLGVSYVDLKAQNQAKLKEVRTAGEQYALFVCVSKWNYTFAYFAVAFDLEAFLVKPSTGQIVWKNRLQGTKPKGLLVPGSTVYEELLPQLFIDFPKMQKGAP